MTALGAVVVWRTYFACRACGLGGYLADTWLGLEGYLTRGAIRLICLLGGQGSFAIAARLLGECCGWKVSDERIRQACQAEATPIAEFRAASPAVAEAFAAAAGDIEFQTDAAKVNTTGGWRDMKIGIFARRERGEPAAPADWDKRDLPAPTTMVAQRGTSLARGGGCGHADLRPFVVVNVLLIAIWALTGAGYFWPVWPLLGWGVGIAAERMKARTRSGPGIHRAA